MKMVMIVGQDISGNNYYLIEHNNRGRYIVWESRYPQGIHKIDFFVANENGVKLKGNAIMSCVADTSVEALKTLGYVFDKQSSLTAKIAPSSIKTAFVVGRVPITPGMRDNGYDFYQLNNGDTVSYFTYIKSTGRVSMRFFETDSQGHDKHNYDKDMEFNTHCPKEALKEWGYQLVEKLGTPSCALNEENWEENAKKKQDEIWKHMCR